MEATQRITDATLVGRCREGDEEAWNMLVDRFSRYVHAICVQAFRLPPRDAEDVFQDVFTKVFQQLSKLRSDDAIRPWIAQLTRRTCIDRLRADRPETPLEQVEPVGVDDRIEELNQALAVRECVLRLPEGCQEILDRFFARDESYRTIGDALELPAGTIASRISRCLEKLKAAMEDGEAKLRPVDG